MSRTLVVLIGMLVFLLLPTVDADAKGWRGIVPLKSTRADVEKLLGLPGKHGRYQFGEERAYVNYAGPSHCNPVNDCICLVSKDVVISIWVELEVEMRFSALKIDKAKYEKYISPENPSLVSYSNDEEGIIYTVEDDDVSTIEYIPRTKDCKKLMRRYLRQKAQHQLRHPSATRYSFT